MAYEIGTADNYKDLLTRLKNFLSDSDRTIASSTNISEISAIPAAEEWAVKQYSEDVDGAGTYQLIVEGPGTSGTDHIFVGIKTETGTVAAGNYYNWRLYGFTGFTDGGGTPPPITDQPGVNSNQPRMLLWNGSIPYWFFANGRRFIVIAKVSTVYESCYMGFLLPYCNPTQNPYPLVIGGSYGRGDQSGTSAPRYSLLTNEHTSFVDYLYDSLTYSSLMILYNGTWLGFSNYSSNSRQTWPYKEGYNYIQSHLLFSLGSASWWQHLQAQLDGGITVFPVCLFSTDTSKAMIGELQGCMAAAGTDIGVEDVATIDGDEYIIFQNTYRTEAYCFWAVKKE